MKKVLLTIISVCLIAASIFGLFAGVSSFSDIMNVKEYKEKDAEEGLEAIETLNDGLDLLQENEGTYLAGVDTYTAGLIAYSEGKTQLSAGYAAYYAGKKQLEEGKAAYAAGKKQIEDNTCLLYTSSTSHPTTCPTTPASTAEHSWSVRSRAAITSSTPSLVWTPARR